jgi:putative hydrolase of the HAD superfamily
MKRVEAICLDLDDTLWPVEAVIERAEAAMVDWLARHYPRVAENHDVHSMRVVRQRMADEFPDMRHDLTFLRRQALAWHAREAGYAEDMVDEALEYSLPRAMRWNHSKTWCRPLSGWAADFGS